MATTGRGGRLEPFERVQLVAFVAVCVLVFVTVFVGIGAVVEGVAGFDDRVPFYVLTMALTFSGAIVAFDAEFEDRLATLPWACAVGIGTFTIVGFAGEGTAFIIRHPNDLVVIEIAFYVLAAILASSGLGYWIRQHWDRLAPSQPGL